ncbi:hypothetical protein FAI40_08175 [Acetobacteraceae bacterium]|nr:hypothetical protein FAI40_08175 [Acetobacteraceae bacterium]
MFAAFSESWEDGEILLDNGANPWAYDKFGLVIDADDFHSPTTERDVAAYWRVREKLLKMGYSIPTPRPKEILKMAEEGK